ncbi:hypothetical protein EBT31_19245 [bacterium]|nr:hypothetical protein [bacterium]
MTSERMRALYVQGVPCIEALVYADYLEERMWVSGPTPGPPQIPSPPEYDRENPMFAEEPEHGRTGAWSDGSQELSSTSGYGCMGTGGDSDGWTYAEGGIGAGEADSGLDPWFDVTTLAMMDPYTGETGNSPPGSDTRICVDEEWE